MGGKWWLGRKEYATTPTVEECQHLDVNSFTDDLEPGTAGTIRWGESDESGPSIGFAIVPDGPDGESVAVKLRYTVTRRADREGEETDHEYRIPITYTECNFGGKRPWFLCPSAGCSRRVGKLYLPPGGERFACRHCYDLGYRSSRESGDPMKKALRRFQRAQKKLDVGPTTPESGGYDDLYPDRPKGMHRSTYRDLMDELDAARDEWYGEFRAEVRAMQERART